MYSRLGIRIDDKWKKTAAAVAVAAASSHSDN